MRLNLIDFFLLLRRKRALKYIVTLDRKKAQLVFCLQDNVLLCVCNQSLNSGLTHTLILCNTT